MVVNTNITRNNTTIIDLIRNDKLNSFIEYFRDLKDLRDDRNGNFQYHKLDLFLLCFVGNLCGEATQNGIYQFEVKHFGFLTHTTRIQLKNKFNYLL